MSKPLKNIRKLSLDPFTNVSNISSVREDLKSYCLENLREVALSIDSLVLTDIEVIPDIPQDLQSYIGTNDPCGFKARAYEHNLKTNKELIKARKSQLEELYGIIHSTFTPDVKLRVENHPDFDAIQLSYNGFQLWRHVIKVLTSGTPNESNSLRTYRVNQNYFSCIMRPDEHLTDFAIRFKDAVMGIRNNAGEEAVPSGPDQAMQFLESLSSRHSEFKAATINAISNKTSNPGSVQDILNLATNFRPVMPSSFKSSNVNNSVMYAASHPQYDSNRPSSVQKENSY